MKMKKMIYFLFALLFLNANSMKAQVAIGTENPDMNPHPGAILDLGQVKNKDLGLLLPKVTLTADDVWTPVEGEEVDGMMVYNDSPCAINGLDGKGAYVWYDDSWHILMEPASFTCGDKLKDFDGNTYATADFGVAGCWMQENLKTTHYADCTPITYKGTSVNDGKDYNVSEYTYPNKDQANVATLGLLYTWAAAARRISTSSNEGNTDQTPVQGACPIGWHLPSDKEWSQLEYEIDKNATNKYSSLPANTATVDYYTPYVSNSYRGKAWIKMKSVTKILDTDPNNGTSNTIANNGFCGFPTGGCYNDNRSPFDYGTRVHWWTSSNRANNVAYVRWSAATQEDGLCRYANTKYLLFSVRCKKND